MRDLELSVVCGPDEAKARVFASAYGIASTASSIASAAGRMDAAIICSPSQQHVQQALELLGRGIPTLIELPAYGTRQDAIRIAASAGGTYVACAHTSRYLRPFRMLHRWIAEGRLGVITQVHYIRHIPPRQRSWKDDALIHHASHILDLQLHWFESLRPVACLAEPHTVDAQDLSLLGIAGAGTLVNIDISYTSRLPQLAMTVAGSRHSIVTDGFSFLRSDVPELEAQFDGQTEYENATLEQDRDFLARTATRWEETIRLAELTDAYRTLGAKT
jgi:predicted dehydrogenase